MARIKSGGGRSFSGGGFKSRSGGFRSSGSRSGFRASGTRHYGGYSHRYRPYRRNYFFHSLGPTGKIIYIIIVIIFLLFSLMVQ